MAKVLSGVMAVAMVAVLFVGAEWAAGDWLGTRSGLAGNPVMSRAQGLMPEVVVTADMPRLVMPTVEVRPGRTVAMSGSDLHVF